MLRSSIMGRAIRRLALLVGVLAWVRSGVVSGGPQTCLHARGLDQLACSGAAALVAADGSVGGTSRPSGGGRGGGQQADYPTMRPATGGCASWTVKTNLRHARPAAGDVRFQPELRRPGRRLLAVSRLERRRGVAAYTRQHGRGGRRRRLLHRLHDNRTVSWLAGQRPDAIRRACLWSA